MEIKNIKKYIALYDTEKYLFDVVGKEAREKGFLSFMDFYKICMWKSARPKQRFIKNRLIVEDKTREAFEVEDEAEKIKILCSLDGVGIPTASAILTIVFPEKYAIIDVRCLEMLNEKFSFKLSKIISIKVWLKYLEIMRKFATLNNVTPREVDMAFFAMHREKLESEDFRNLYN